MSKILYIKANPKQDEDSLTFRLSNLFVEEYKKNNPEDEIKTLDLYKENITYLNENDLETMRSEESRIYKYAEEFAKADKYIFSAPMWNLSIPAILKAYIDYITLLNVTFKYTEHGAVGLLDNKKALHIVTRGGLYSTPPMSELEMGDRYLKTILAFMGVTNTETIALELTNVLLGEAKEQSISSAEEKIVISAKTF